MPQNEDLFVRHIPIAGTLATGAGVLRYGLPRPCELLRVDVNTGTTSAGADVILDINKNGTTIFTDQTKRPKVLAGSLALAAPIVVTPPVAATTLHGNQADDTGVGYVNVVGGAVPNPVPVASFVAGDYITVDVDQIGSNTTEGANAVVTLLFRYK